jgi:flagellar protein FliS
MDAREAALAYKRAAIESAPPVRIVRLLYDGAIRYLDQAAACDPARALEAYKERLQRADAVVTELRLALDHAHAGGPSGELERLYVYVEEQIARAQSGSDPSALPAARAVLAKLNEAWTELEKGGAKPA